MIVNVPGAVWWEYLDPATTGMHDELGLDAYGYSYRRVGKGGQYTYDMPYAVATELADYLEDRGGLLLSNDPPEERDRHRRALALAADIRERVRTADTPRACVCGEPEDGGQFGWYTVGDTTRCNACGATIK